MILAKTTEDFKCTITQELMDDPVIFSSGRTIMDRASAQEYINRASAEGRLPLCTESRAPMFPVAVTITELRDAIHIYRSQQPSIDLTQ